MRSPLTWVVMALLAVAAIALLGRLTLRREPPAAASLDPAPARAASGEKANLPAAPESTDPHPLPDVLVDPRVLVSKSERRLTVFSEEKPVKGYRVALGGQPQGDKEREGDNRTPEGEFYVCSRNRDSKFHRALGLSYPSEVDADRGLAEKMITKREHRSIVTAIHRMQRPPWNTALGGEIMIHGGGARRGDWTEGCIALDDGDIDELFTALPLGTPIEIAP